MPKFLPKGPTTGAERAVGHGRAVWVWPAWCVACGGVSLPAMVVAFGRTTCQGHSAYAYVEWFFPSRGQSFNRRLARENVCGGASRGQTFACDRGDFTNVTFELNPAYRLGG